MTHSVAVGDRMNLYCCLIFLDAIFAVERGQNRHFDTKQSCDDTNFIGQVFFVSSPDVCNYQISILEKVVLSKGCESKSVYFQSIVTI